MTLMKRHPLIAFFVLTFALSWWPWLLYTVHLFPSPVLPTGTNGSLFIALVFHASYDALGEFVYPLFSGPDLLRNYVLSAVVAGVVALIVVIATGPAQLSRASRQVTTPVAERAAAGVITEAIRTQTSV